MKHLQKVIVIASLTVPISSFAEDYTSPIEPSTPERGNYENSAVPDVQGRELGEPCTAVTTDYAAFFRDMWEDKPPLLNECGLGALVNFNLLQGFDPIGKILNAIKGAVCGVINDKVHDPFVRKINSKLEQYNRWVNDTNNQYSGWIDQETRNLQYSIYDPRTRYNKDGLTFSGLTPMDPVGNPYANPGQQGSGDGQPAGEGSDEIINESGGGTTTVITGGDGEDVNIFQPGEDQTDDSSGWEDLYQLYQ